MGWPEAIAVGIQSTCVLFAVIFILGILVTEKWPWE